jgi:amino-acid N-acetyltransferase
MDLDIKLRMAQPSDAGEIAALLTRCDLSPGEAFTQIDQFKVAMCGTRLVACGAAASLGDAVLIRNVAVEPAYRNRGIATRLVECLLMRARSSGARSVYLVTATAPTYFSRWGFLLIAADRAPEDIRASSAYAYAGRATSHYMRCELN